MSTGWNLRNALQRLEVFEEYRPNGQGDPGIHLQDLRRELAVLSETVAIVMEKCDRLEKLVGRAPAKREPRPIGSGMPPRANIDRMSCQIIHNPNLTAKVRKDKKWTVWRLKFEAYKDDSRVCEFYLNTCPPDYFVRHYAEKAYDPAPDETKQFLGARFPGLRGHLVGMLKPSIIGRGSGWKHDHTAVLVGHEEDKPHVYALFDGELYEWHNFVPPDSGDAIAKWYCDWRP